MADKTVRISGYAEGNLSSWLARNNVSPKEAPEYRSAFTQSYLALIGIGQPEDSAVSAALMSLNAKHSRTQDAKKAETYPIKLILEPMKIDTV